MSGQSSKIDERLLRQIENWPQFSEKLGMGDEDDELRGLGLRLGLERMGGSSWWT